MIISGHQPAYLPWLGYFHKLSLCDAFVYMDTVQYLENDWNNRNKLRSPQGWNWLTVPINRRESKGKMLHEIMINNEDYGNKNAWNLKHWQMIEFNYRKCKYFDTYAEELYKFYFERKYQRLIDLCWAQFHLFLKWLKMEGKVIVRMSEHQFDGRKAELVLDHCRQLGGNYVVFGCNGKNYVDLSIFHQHGIQVYFQDYIHPIYPQRFSGFEPHMSVLDLILNCGPESLSIIRSGNVSQKDLFEQNLWE